MWRSTEYCSMLISIPCSSWPLPGLFPSVIIHILKSEDWCFYLQPPDHGSLQFLDCKLAYVPRLTFRFGGLSCRAGNRHLGAQYTDGLEGPFSIQISCKYVKWGPSPAWSPVQVSPSAPILLPRADVTVHAKEKLTQTRLGGRRWNEVEHAAVIFTYHQYMNRHYI